MLVLGLSLMLAIVSIALFPCWRYSERWGYRPSIAAGMLLVFVALVAVAGKETHGVSPQTSVAQLPSPDNQRDWSPN